MEKKKLLLVAISVGIFLVLTIGAALLVFTPKNTFSTSAVASYPSEMINTSATIPTGSATESSTAVQATNSKPASLDPVELVRNSGEVPGLTSPPAGATRQGSEFYANGTGRNTETVISIPKPSTAAVPDAPPAGRAESAARPAPASTTTPKSTATPAPAPSKPAPVASTQSQAKPATVQAKVHDDYWVQTGAFSTVARAEGVKETLASRGITSIIENREVNGRTFFRVRLGPYTSQNEANYWLSLIKSISGFEDSQVRQTQSRR